jgi:hypothetical protein
MLRLLLLAYEYLRLNTFSIQNIGIISYALAEHVDSKRFFNSMIYGELQGRRLLVGKLSSYVGPASV